ncbi:MAG: hypothetical protein DCC49_00725 [Acidobacteria bacterium]|nr:MAG: hypothetical protein DCC49_00725 [Acidobacteriota bacterium]
MLFGFRTPVTKGVAIADADHAKYHFGTVRIGLAGVALAICLTLAGACAPAPASDSDASRSPEPTPSHQPVPGPPVTDARRLRDELLSISAKSATTETVAAWGIKAAWARIFPKMHFAPFESPATTDTVSGGESLANERGSELTATLTFAVVDVSGVCSGGYIAGPTGPGLPTRFDALDPPDACNASAVYLIRNPVPEPEPEPAPVRRGGGRSGGSSGGQSGPQTRTGQIEKRDLGSDSVSRSP